MARIIFRPHNLGSNGLDNLVEALREEHNGSVLRVRGDGNYRPRPKDTQINWGASKQPTWAHAGMQNQPVRVAHSSNKIDAFHILHNGGVRIPTFTGDAGVAQQWLGHGDTVIERHVLNGSGGDGIIIAPPGGARVGQAPLYTKYIKKKNEYRIHVFNGRIIDQQEKRRRRDLPDDNRQTLIRNLANGYVFCHDNVNPDQDVHDQALAAVRALGLDFGAVDVIWNERRHEAYVLEVNTMPGLEGQTVQAYKNAILGLTRE